jgi:NOL1/NOP2/sun family putative RNA methylase
MEHIWSDFQGRYDSLIPEINLFKDKLQDDFPVCLRPNLSQMSLESFKDYLLEFYPDSHAYIPFSCLPIVIVKGERKYWGGRLEHHVGLYFMQAISSLIPVEALDIKPNDRVLDMCAAPGGKTTHIASKLGDKGLLYANEPNIGRGRVLKANIDKMSLSGVIVLQYWGEKLPFESNSFDKILLDGPCSSEGTLRDKMKKSNYTKYNETFRVGLQRSQKELLIKAFDLLKPGGTLIYSTCTYDPDENEKQVFELLRCHDNAQLLPLPSMLDELPLTDGLSIDDVDLSLTKRVYPHYIDSIGFYLAKLTKR